MPCMPSALYGTIVDTNWSATVTLQCRQVLALQTLVNLGGLADTFFSLILA
jgi:hypothetical protein